MLMLMNSIGACICEVLLHAGEQASQQAQLLMSCITRGLCGSVGQAVMAATLLLTVLEHLTDSDGAVWEPLRKVSGHVLPQPGVVTLLEAALCVCTCMHLATALWTVRALAAWPWST